MSQTGERNASMSQEGGRVAIPWRQRWRLFRSQTLPGLGFLAIVAVTAWMWGKQSPFLAGTGTVEAIRVDVASASSGRLAALPGSSWRLFETVDANQVLARLDDQALRAALTVCQRELEKLKKQLAAEEATLALTEADRARGYQTETARLRVELEKARLATLGYRTQVEADAVELERCNVRLEYLRPLYAKKAVADLEMNDERMLQQAAARRLEENRKTLRQAENNEREAAARLQQFPTIHRADAEKTLAPIAAEIDVQQAMLHELETQLDQLTIRAPIRGMICAIHHWPGANVQAGDPIMTLADEHGRYIVSYVRQEQRITPQAGMAVAVRKRAAASLPIRSVVERVGAQVEEIPVQHCRDPRTPEWGLPLRIALPHGLSATPGEILEISLQMHP